jgi:hypothetical protein
MHFFGFQWRFRGDEISVLPEKNRIGLDILRASLFVMLSSAKHPSTLSTHAAAPRPDPSLRQAQGSAFDRLRAAPSTGSGQAF